MAAHSSNKNEWLDKMSSNQLLLSWNPNVIHAVKSALNIRLGNGALARAGWRLKCPPNSQNCARGAPKRMRPHGSKHYIKGQEVFLGEQISFLKLRLTALGAFSLMSTGLGLHWVFTIKKVEKYNNNKINREYTKKLIRNRKYRKTYKKI